jgi:choline dehydrogenase-like flavoprotein
MDRWANYTPSESRLAAALNVAAAALLCCCLALVILPFVFRDAPLFTAPPFFLTNSAAGLALMAYLAWSAAADVRRYRPMIAVVVGGFLIGAAASLALLLQYPDSIYSVALVIAFGLCCAAALALTWLSLRAERPQAPWLPWIPDKPITPWERAAQVIFAVFGLVSLLAAFGSLLLPAQNDPALAGLLVNPLMIAGSAIKLGVLGLCALPVALDVRRYTQHVQMITAQIVGNVASFIIIVVVGLLGYDRFGDYTLTVGGVSFARDTMMIGALALDVVVVIGFVLLNGRINAALLHMLGFINPSQFRALEATAETLVAGKDAERVPPHEIVLRTDGYLRSFRSDRLGLARLAAIGLQLSPLGWLKPPINYMNPVARTAFINARFKEEILNPPLLYRLLDAVLRLVNTVLLLARRRPIGEVGAALSFTGLLEAVMRFNMQLTFLGYYSNPAAWPKAADGSGIGYTPFSQRPKQFDPKPIRNHPPLQVMTPQVIEQQGIDVINDADVVIIGSGAAGAILAEQLVGQGRRVLILEKGLYVPPDDFSEDEVDMISRLYSDGALQISQALRFTILQGSCVGGTTVVNNAVCFDTPRPVLERWNGRASQGNVIDPEAFYAAQAQVRKRMRIGPIKAGTRQPLEEVLNHGDSLITAAVHHYFQNRPDTYRYDVIEANIVDCLGCGYCNIGCKYGRKMSMLDEVLPAAQHKCGAENLRIISEANVTKLVEDNGTITQVVATIQDKRKLVINQPKTVIVSGGTIQSSWLLMESGIGKRKLPVGQGLSFNMGSPLHALFDRELHAYDGLQISHYLALDDHPGFVYETWYNPPVAQALAMPGWLDTHFANMQNYNRMAGVGVLVGTESNAYVTRALVTGGPDIVFQPTPGDLKKLVDALVILGDIYFTGGALEIYASTRRYVPYLNDTAVIRAQSQVDRLRELVKHDYDILLGTGHPQGGNAIGLSPSNSVIGSDFKVFGYRNLYVCDASVFPTSTTVNPQLTVMTLAHYAAGIIQ